MRVLVISDLYPPVAFGGYEADCAAFVACVGVSHDVLVLTSDLDRETTPGTPGVRRELPWGRGGKVRRNATAAVAAARGARVVRQVVEDFSPDLVFVWNLLGVPQASVVPVLAGRVPVAVRLAETYFATQLLQDRFLRQLAPGQPALRGVVSRVVRLLNRLPVLQIDPVPRAPVAVAWASADLSRRVTLPPHLEIALSRVVHPTSTHAAGFASLERRPFEAPTVLYLGRVTLDKGAEVAYRALALLRQSHDTHARLVVVGPVDPATRRRLDRVADELGISTAVELRGRLEGADFAPLLQGAHALLVPSLVQDVFPLVVGEAALARLPVVASRIGGIPEVVTEGDEALFFTPGDAEGAAAALAETLADPAGADARAARAFARLSALTMDHHAVEWQAFLDDALEALRRDGLSGPGRASG